MQPELNLCEEDLDFTGAPAAPHGLEGSHHRQGQVPLAARRLVKPIMTMTGVAGLMCCAGFVRALRLASLIQTGASIVYVDESTYKYGWGMFNRRV